LARLTIKRPRWLFSLFSQRKMMLEEVQNAGNVGEKPSAEYLASLNVLDNIVRDCLFQRRAMRSQDSLSLEPTDLSD